MLQLAIRELRNRATGFALTAKPRGFHDNSRKATFIIHNNSIRWMSFEPQQMKSVIWLPLYLKVFLWI